ncbi:DegT/DnrJ/EryC1/StrS aminotransferase family protein [Chryseobacterium polytrichastri]|uniref:DegT/DnrJ/EryC1/StrS aminotransferase family protein n=2 Tax=Chryseobacterium polytrichastri TaxID=1302687 RepID=A0A1M6U586_9FLAO|nr:DegT/DnrJ/EryC1/StrS aminotransferase family protein [Chryseobacterium polytrichastri]
MKVLGNGVKKSQKNHDFYQQIFKDIDGVNLFSAINEDFYSNYWLNTVLIDDCILSKENVKDFFSQNNIETRYLWNPIHLQPLYNKYIFLEVIFLV